jgi:hypothetical protein
MSFTQLVDLLEKLLANKDRLVDKTEGKSKGKANQKSYVMQTIRSAFPSEKESYGTHYSGIGTCILHLLARYVKRADSDLSSHPRNSTILLCFGGAVFVRTERRKQW